MSLPTSREWQTVSEVFLFSLPMDFLYFSSSVSLVSDVGESMASDDLLGLRVGNSSRRGNYPTMSAII